MVLEGSTSEDGFGNDASAPPSDNDIYNSQTETISYESLAQNLPRSPFGSESELQRVILARVKEHEGIVKRPLTKSEAEFSAYYSAKFYAIASYGRPVGTCYGLWRSYATRSTYKFPFLKPNFIQNPEIFPHERFAWLKGNAARGAWHGLRTTAHVWLGLSVAQLLFGVYGASVISTAVAKDPRSKVFLDALRKQRDESRAASPLPPRQTEPDQSPSTDGYQDASPVNEMQEAYQPNEFREASPSYRIQEESPTSRYQEEPSSSGNEEPFSTNEAQSREESSTGSAWDRVRQQSPSGKKLSFENSVHRERDSPPITPKKDDDIQSSREKAQREFDERVEQERRGEGFDAGKGGSNRW